MGNKKKYKVGIKKRPTRKKKLACKENIMKRYNLMTARVAEKGVENILEEPPRELTIEEQQQVTYLSRVAEKGVENVLEENILEEPPRELTIEEQQQRERDLEKEKLKRKLKLIKVDMVGNLEERALRIKRKPSLAVKNTSKSKTSGSDGENKIKSENYAESDSPGSSYSASDSRLVIDENFVANDDLQGADDSMESKLDKLLVVRKRGRPRKVIDPLDPNYIAPKKRREPKTKLDGGKSAVKRNDIIKLNRIIVRVYRYLEQEYELIKASIGKCCDLSILANILKRTAEAIGVGEKTVTNVLKAEKMKEEKLRRKVEIFQQERMRAIRKELRDKEKKAKMDKENNISKKNQKKKDKINATSEVTTVYVNSDAPSEMTCTVIETSEVATVLESNATVETLHIEVFDEEYDQMEKAIRNETLLNEPMETSHEPDITPSEFGTDAGLTVHLTTLPSSNSDQCPPEVKLEPVDSDLLEPVNTVTLGTSPQLENKPIQNADEERARPPDVETHTDPVERDLQETSSAVQNLQALLEDDPLS